MIFVFSANFEGKFRCLIERLVGRGIPYNQIVSRINNFLTFWSFTKKMLFLSYPFATPLFSILR